MMSRSARCVRPLSSRSRMFASSSLKYSNTDEVEEETETDLSDVKIVNNDIYFSCDVTADTALQLTMAVKEVTKKNQIMSINFGIDPPPVNIYINSDGGEVHSALSVFDQIRNNPVDVTTIISGNAQSAATIISLSGHNRQITANSYMLIHNISSSFWGKMHEFEDEMKNMSKLTANLKKIYKDNTSITKAKLNTILTKDLLIDSKECLRLGLVDEII